MIKFLKNLFGSFYPAFEKGWVETCLSFRRLTLRTLFEDFIAVASNIGFVIVPAFLVSAAFLFLPQGHDTLLLVVEKLSVWNVAPLFFLLLGLTTWSIISELSVRYAIYISDNSGKNLTDNRVQWRKTVQKILAAFFLLWPPFMVFVGLLYNLFAASYMDKTPRYICFSICLFMVYWLMSSLSNIYFRKSGGSGPGVYKITMLGERSLPNKEQQYLRKLYGIYQDYVYTLPKASSFQQPYKEELQKFTDNFTKSDIVRTEEFPQNDKVLKEIRRVPAEFELINSVKILQGIGELYKWIYKIPTNFYMGLHKQIKWFSGLSLLLFVFLCIISGDSPIFGWIGAPAIICFAFACYTGIYTGLLYLDKSRFKNWKLSIRFLLVVILIISSVYNNDHSVRESGSVGLPRASVLNQFNSWFTNYKNEIDKQNPNPRTDKKYPVIFICAEGGALRTGAYTSLFLSGLENKLAKEHNIDFNKSVFAMSGVSGGALGLGFYNAIAFENKQLTDSGTEKSKNFFQYDSLSPLIGKMLFGDFLNLFLPWHFDQLDRSVALEKSWEKAYSSLINNGEKNVFSGNFVSSENDPHKPLLIINTTEIESGLQCWISNLRPDSLIFLEKRDLLNKKVKNINYSTAINFSTRFPLFSPAAKVGGKNGIPNLHYLDGGYVENTGTASMLEILELLKNKSPNFRQIAPIVINLLFSEEDTTDPDINIFNELTEIYNGLANTRSGRSKTSRFQIKEFVKQHNKGFVIDAPLSPKEKNVPMNWVLSAQSMNYIERDVNSKLENNAPEAIISRLLRKDLRFLKAKLE